MKAGEDLRFTIKLDKAPTFDGGYIQYSVIAPTGSTSTTTYPINAGQKELEVVFRVPATVRGGEFTIHVLGFWTGFELIPIKATDVSFEVLPLANGDFPTSAEIQVNPSQVQLFRQAAVALQLQVQDFKTALLQADNRSPGAIDVVIRKNVSKALESLEKTQIAFRNLGGTSREEVTERVFFDDLRLSYQEFVKALDKSQATLRDVTSGATVPRVLTTARHTNAPQSNAPLVAQAALRPFEQNVAAYNLAADAQSLTFDLTVDSSPAGASTCYHRRGDACHQNPDATDTVIKSLPLAIWIVKFDKSGYRSEEREHDPFREPNHVIHVDLKQ
ncbi:MAG: hypothetical protein WCA15_09380 [Candidatus Acidiferrales bacterium]